MKRYLYTSLLLLLGVVAEVCGQSKTISGGDDHGVIICAQGYLYTWGLNEKSNIGKVLGIDPDDPATGANAELKVVYTPSRVKTDNLTFNMVTAGSGAFNLALSCNKIVYGWGDNQTKACSPTEGTLVKYPTPIVKGDTPGYNLDGTPGGEYLGGVTYIAASTASGFAIMDDGRLVGWGKGGQAQWSDNARTQAGYPTYINGPDGKPIENVTHISGGDNNCMIRTADGNLYCIGPWNGNNARDQTKVFDAVPVMISGDDPYNETVPEDGEQLMDIRMSAAADVAGYAVTGDGYVWAWGNGGWGNCTGQKKTGTHTRALKVLSGQYGEKVSGEEYLTDVKEVIGGRGYGAAVTKEGYLVYWGNNDDNGGVVPTDETTAKTYSANGGGKNIYPILAKYCNASGEPDEVIMDAVSISRGDNYGFMINSKDEYYAWGLNDNGQTGSGDATVTKYNCLTKLKTIPCEIQDACPSVFMINRTKCPGEEIELDCGYTIPKGKEDRYYVSWYLDGKLLNTTTKNSSSTERLKDPYNSATINITEPGTYKVEVEYIGTNIPCDACEPVETECVVKDMDMPIDTIITDMNCVAGKLETSGTDVICYEATVNDKFYKSTQTAKFAAFATETSTDTLTYDGKNIVVTAKGAGGKIEFCVTGDQIAASEIHDNAALESKDTTYTVWLEDITSFDTYIFKDVAVSDMTAGSYQKETIILDMYATSDLKSFDVYSSTHNGVGTVTLQPVIYKASKNENGEYVIGATYFTGEAQTFDITADATKCTVKVGCKVEGSSSRGVKYILGVIVVGSSAKIYKFKPATRQTNSPLYKTEIQDSEEFGIYAIGSLANSMELGGGNGGDEACISNINFGKLTDYDCGRIMLSARYGCPPCSMPDGNKITIEENNGTDIQIDEDNVKFIKLCKESPAVSLTVKNVQKEADPSAKFDILWYQGSLTGKALQTDEKASSSILSPDIAWDATLEGTTVKYYAMVRDNANPTSAMCFVYDSINIIYNKLPIAPAIEEIKFCESAPASQKTALTDALAGADFDGYTVNWYSDALKTKTSTEPDLTTLKYQADSYEFFYTITDPTTECESEVATLTVTVWETPAEDLDQISDFCVHDATVVYPVSALGYTVKWWSKADASEESSEVLEDLEPGSYTVWYTVTNDNGCVSEVYERPFNVKDSVRLKLDSTMICGKTTVTTSGITPASATLVWTLAGTTVASTEFSEADGTGSLGELSVVASASGYCDNTYKYDDIYVKATATKPTGTFFVSYLKSDAVAGAFEDILTKDSKVVDVDAAYTLNWYDADKNPMTSVPVPPYPSDAVTDDQTYTYYVSRTNADGCTSELEEITVVIYLTPTPTPVTPVYYCLNSTNALPLSATVNDPGATGKFSLVWYDTDNTTVLAAAPTPDVTTVGKTTYYVSQKSTDGAESSHVPVNVTIFGVKEPELDATNVLAYCSSKNTSSALKANYVRDEDNGYYASALVWEMSTDGGAYSEVSAPVTPIIDVSATTTYSYKVHQIYEITSTGETCVGEAVQTDVTVTYVAPVVTQEVLYLKAAANAAGTFDKCLTEQNADAVTDITTGATLQWYQSDCTTKLDACPAPTLNAAVAEGDDQLETYCVSQVVKISDELSCESKTTTISVRISDALPPIVYSYYYCEGQTMTDLSVDINPQAGKTKADYEIYWYGTTKPANTSTATPVSTGTTYAMGSAAAAVEGGVTTDYKYYVAQHDLKTGAVSAAQEVLVRVQPKPIVTVTQPEAVCEADIDLSEYKTVKNVSETFEYTYYNASEEDMRTSLVSKTGVYYVDAKYNLTVPNSTSAIVSDLVCQGEKVEIDVTVNDLTTPVITGSPTTCPGTSVELEVSATSTDPGTDLITYQWGGDAASVADGSTTSTTFKTQKLSQKTGTTYSFTVVAKAGACTKEVTAAEAHVVTVGDGVVTGNMTYTEEGNEEAPGGFDNNDTEHDIYSCGNPITISVTYEGDQDYVWYKNGTQIASGVASLTTEAYSTYADDIYTIEWTNECKATTDLKVHIVPVSAEALSTEAIEICEGVPFTSEFSYTLKPGETPTIDWYRDGRIVSGQVGSKMEIQNTKKSDSGVYSFTIKNRGCQAQGTTNTLTVKPYIQASIQSEPFIVDRHATGTMTISYTVPTSYAVKNQKWIENGEVAYDGNPFVLDDVTADHYYTIELSDPDYCDAQLSATVYVDAELTLKTTLKDTLCLGTTEVFVIDTTGTGAFRRPNGNPQLNVTAKVGDGAEVNLNDKITKRGDMLNIAVSPADNATYTVSFSYNGKEVNSEEKVVVIPGISVTTPDMPNVCSGDETTLTVTGIQPEGTTVSWADDSTIVEGKNSETLRVRPVYSGTSADHQSKYNYTVIAYNSICDNKREYIVPVLVDEPLIGTITGDPEICQGKEAVIDASSYLATTYKWYPDSTGVMVNARETVSPNASTDYTVEMSRGLCTAKDTFTVTVFTNPVITSIDSIALRDRQIILEPGYGTAPYTYAVDAKAADDQDVKKDLAFAKHIVYVYDSKGCMTSMNFMLEAPAISVPDHFTPNGDGVDDNWIIPAIGEVYPNAVVTIYDRYGKVLKQYLGADTNGWDGTYKGNNLPSTDYWYQITIEEIDKEYVGHFTLIRR